MMKNLGHEALEEVSASVRPRCIGITGCQQDHDRVFDDNLAELIVRHLRPARLV